jgi:Putative MetA-pathway of phenol degradation
MIAVKRRMNRSIHSCALICLTVLGLSPSAATAQTQGDGPRVYWKGLSGTRIVTVWLVRAGGNASPFDPVHQVLPDVNFDATMALLGYHTMLPVFGRSATASLSLPVGNIHTTASVGVPFYQETTRGFGDPVLQLNTNLVGAPAMNTLSAVLRYEPTFTLDVLTALAFPIGEYDGAQVTSIGQNRWYGRAGLPMMYTFHQWLPWVPGTRTTMEVLPALWIFGANEDYLNHQTLENDPLLQLEGHLTRDLSEALWASLDASWFNGARPELNGASAGELNSAGVGLSLGFQINDNLMIHTSYFATVGGSDAQDLDADEFRLMINYGWHPLIEGMKRLQKER